MNYIFESQGRNIKTECVLGALLVFVIAGYLLLDMHIGIIATIAIFALPAVWDLVSNRPSGLALNDTQITWFSGKAHGEVCKSDVDYVQFHTRLDLSIRVTLVLHGGQKIRLPQDAVPPLPDLESALVDRDITIRRQHFALLN